MDLGNRILKSKFVINKNKMKKNYYKKIMKKNYLNNM